MECLRELIEKISEDPCLYLGKISIERLRAFISGFLDQNTAADDRCMNGFNEFVAKKYHMNTDHDWSSYIQFFSKNEQEAYKIFTQYFVEYQDEIKTNGVYQNSDDLYTNVSCNLEKEGFAIMLDRVLSSPQLYLGKLSLERLSAYINGFLAHEDIANYHPLEGFNEYIKRTYNIQTEHDWPEIICFFSPNDQYAFESFARHYKAFQREQERKTDY